MRYLGLMFLGMVIYGGHTAGAVEMTAAESMKVVTNGKVVSEHTRLTEKWKDTIRTTRIIWEGRFYICEDYVVFDPKHRLDVGTGRAVVRCFDNEKVSD